jgi:hypothetical protein
MIGNLQNRDREGAALHDFWRSCSTITVVNPQSLD